jgi:hypothetical protein
MHFPALSGKGSEVFQQAFRIQHRKSRRTALGNVCRDGVQHDSTSGQG